VLIVMLLLTTTLATAATAQNEEDLKSYYPNTAVVSDGVYLVGFNHVSGSAQRSGLWFELKSGGRFKQYNSAPDDPNTKCHFDKLRWRGEVLRYSKTQDSCGGIKRETKFSPSIRLMPRYWAPGEDWSLSGTSKVTHLEDGDVKCRGLNEWTATVEGWVEIAPDVQAIHVSSVQKTTWTEGQSSTGCAAGFTTDWQEDYYLMPDMAVVGGGTANSFKRSTGGNQFPDSTDRWDVWFDFWTPLPN
jgi:hypothetical protein